MHRSMFYRKAKNSVAYGASNVLVFIDVEYKKGP